MKIMQVIQSSMINILKQRTHFASLINNTKVQYLVVFHQSHFSVRLLFLVLTNIAEGTITELCH